MATLQENSLEIPLYQHVLKILDKPIYKSILEIVGGKSKQGVVFFDSDSTHIDEILCICEKLEIPSKKIKVLDPTKEWSLKFNPFGVRNGVAASNFSKTMADLISEKDDFFKDHQYRTTNAYVLLAMLMFGSDITITRLLNMFLDTRYLADIVEHLRNKVEFSKEDITLNSHDDINSIEQTIAYFENEILDYKTYNVGEAVNEELYPCDHKYAGRQIVANKQEKYIIGLLGYVNQLFNHPMLLNLFISNNTEDAFDTEQFIKDGGVLLVNEATNEVDELSKFFRQYLLNHLETPMSQHSKECVEVKTHTHWLLSI